MMEVFSALSTVLAIVAAIFASLSIGAERLFWGSIFTSLGLGLAVFFSNGGYYSILMMAVFLSTDMLLYLYIRSLSMQPKQEMESFRKQRIRHIFLLWMGLCAFLCGAILLHRFIKSTGFVQPNGRVIEALHQNLWNESWLLVSLVLPCLLLVVVAGFFLVRQERR